MAGRENNLGNAIGNRPTASSLEAVGILKSGNGGRRMSAKLQATALQLEKKIMSDTVAQSLDVRPEMDEIVQMGIISSDAAKVAPGIQAKRRQLQFNMSGDALSQLLDGRPDVEDLSGTGNENVLKYHDISPALQSTANRLEFEMKKNAVGNLLEFRPSAAELEDIGVVAEPKVAPAIQSQARKLEQKMITDTVGHLLDTRPSRKDLVNQGILTEADVEGGVAPAIASAAKDLERQMNANKLNHLLESRPSLSDLKESGIVKNSGSAVSGNIFAVQEKLQKEMTSDYLGSLLEHRPSPDDLLQRNILKDDWVAGSLHARQLELQKNMTKDYLNHLLEERPEPRDLIEQNILKNDWVAGSIQRAGEELKSAMRRSELENMLSHRPSLDEWESEYSEKMRKIEETREEPRAGAFVGGKDLRPAWLRNGISEPPAGTRDMGSWQMSVYTEEQQARLGVTEDGERRKSPIGGSDLRPAWLRNGIGEPPAGTEDMGSWSAAVYTEEQQQRLGVDKDGNRKVRYKATPPAWITSGTEAPAGEKDMGSWTASVFTEEQQARLGVDEYGNKLLDEDDEAEFDEDPGQMHERFVTAEDSDMGLEEGDAYEYNYFDHGQSDSGKLRRHYGIALKAASRLYLDGTIDAMSRSALKELILASDKRVMAAIEVFEIDNDDEEVLDTLARIAIRGVQELGLEHL
eukprot:g689.t1